MHAKFCHFTSSSMIYHDKEHHNKFLERSYTNAICRRKKIVCITESEPFHNTFSVSLNVKEINCIYSATSLYMYLFNFLGAKLGRGLSAEREVV